jgi:hypothetical protein
MRLPANGGPSDLTLNPWKRHGKYRLYANLPDGTAVAWADRLTKVITIKVEKHRLEAVFAINTKHHQGASMWVGDTMAKSTVANRSRTPRRARPKTPMANTRTFSLRCCTTPKSPSRISPTGALSCGGPVGI